jgi:hypothetical protein
MSAISGTSFCLDESENPVVTGTLGDKISNIVLIQATPADALGSVYVLFHDDESTTGLLGNHLLATTHLATDTITSAVNNEYSFFRNANLINVPDLANMQVAIFPLVIPLPFGHGLDGTSIFDGQGMMKLVEQLTKIDPCYGIWLTAMHLSIQYLEGLSLHHPPSIPSILSHWKIRPSSGWRFRSHSFLSFRLKDLPHS